MTFENRRDRHPYVRCECGHGADKHLYCGDHNCITSSCDCSGFTPAERDTWIANPIPETSFGQSAQLISAEDKLQVN